MTQADATGPYLAAFGALSSNGAAAAPNWLKQLRQDAIDHFVEVGFPTTRLEKWRFTSVKSLADASFVLGDGAEEIAATSIDPHFLPTAGSARMVFVNGKFVPRLSTISDLAPGLRITNLATAIVEDEDLVREHFGRVTDSDSNPFVSLNTALASDGAFVYVPEGTVVEAPVQLVFVSTSADGPSMSHPRNLLVLGRESSAAFVESYVSPGDEAYFTNAVTEVEVGDGAQADCYRLQRESERSFHVATTNSSQGRDSRYRLTPMVFGGALSRHDIWMSMQGEGGNGMLNGLYLTGGSQHVDHNTVIEHAVPHCESHEYFNGVLDDQSRAVFNGRIIVRPDAQKTDSKQTNNNLLLSENARADSQPQLEIYADDVRCTHGATLGPLDDDALFYLRSRGMSAADARAMMTYGFGAEILNRVEIESLRERLEHLVMRRLDDGGKDRAA